MKESVAVLPYPLAMIEELSVATESRILLIVLDGVGDIPIDGQTPLSAAVTPNLDRLAKEASLGLSTVVGAGITPGSGPGHLSTFGYDSQVYDVGRGVLSALGLGLDLQPDQVAARGNFATLAGDGTVSDRRAGRISTALNLELIDALRGEISEIDGIGVELYTEAEHRFVVVLKGAELGGSVSETDPGRVGHPPVPSSAIGGEAGNETTARTLNELARRAGEVLADLQSELSDNPVNGVLLRGIGKKPELPSMQDIFRLRPGSVASYPMYRGVSRLVGMECLPMDLAGTGERTANKMAAYAAHAGEHDFIYFHVKRTDTYGEDGNFEAKTAQIEEFDGTLPQLLEWSPDVVVITGDHSTPVRMKAHSWHPLPAMIWSQLARPDGRRFTEADCRGGGLGALRHLDLMPLAMANAGKLRKYGA